MRSSPKAQNGVGDALIHREAAVNWLVLHRMRFITGARGIFLFIQSLLKSPLAVGALVPSSPQLSRLIASQVGCGSSHVLEVGAGTGSITDALLSLGLPANRLFVIERDPSLVAHLHMRFPNIRVRCGDAEHAGAILCEEGISQVQTLISSLPIRNLNGDDRIAIVRGMMKALAADGQLIQFTYSANCPFPTERLGLHAERVGRVWMNIPPAVVWKFTRPAYAVKCITLPSALRAPGLAANNSAEPALSAPGCINN
jgi:phosphatidylethanolamine/phosphatidyl-N-methylethanolamine N-methyltransferase